MSLNAIRYALTVAVDVPPASHGVMFVLAERANGSCGYAIAGGDSIGRVLGLHAGSVRRHIATLERAGVIAVTRRDGMPHVVRFPPGAFIHNPAHSCAGCRAATPRRTARDPAQNCAQPRAELRAEPGTEPGIEPRSLTRAERDAFLPAKFRKRG